MQSTRQEEDRGASGSVGPCWVTESCFEEPPKSETPVESKFFQNFIYSALHVGTCARADALRRIGKNATFRTKRLRTCFLTSCRAHFG